MMLHQRENNQDTETFLKSNGKKFQGDCVTAMKLMYEGVRLNGDTCKQLYNLHDRRLRNCYEARPDIVKREWKLNHKGKRMYVEYFILIPPKPTKTSVIENHKAKVISIGKQINIF